MTLSSLKDFPRKLENSSSELDATKPSQKTRKYITLPGGKRTWVRLAPRKGRGKDVRPRKKGEAHGNWRHGCGKSRSYDPTQYAAWKEAVLKNGGFCCLVTGKTNNLTCHHLDMV
jgi:hypothetical protein